MKLNSVASIGLAIGVVFGMAGQAFTDPNIQVCLYNLSGLGLTMGVALLAVKYIIRKEEFVGTGFLLFAIAEGCLTEANGADETSAASAFAACLLFYFVALCLINSSKLFPIWVRVVGFCASIPFAIAGTKYFLGYGIGPEETLPGIGYGLLSLTIIGWIIVLLREKSVAV